MKSNNQTNCKFMRYKYGYCICKKCKPSAIRKRMFRIATESIPNTLYVMMCGAWAIVIGVSIFG